MQSFFWRSEAPLVAGVMALLINVSSQAYSASDETQKRQNDSLMEEDETSLDIELSSADRISNHTSLQLGLGYRRGPGIEMGLDLYRDEDNLFSFKLGHFASKDQDGFSDLSITHLMAENVFFLGESLFVGIGGSLAKFHGEDREKAVVSSDGIQDFSFEANAYQVTFLMSAGNQWQKEDWTFGFHWLNLYLPFYVTDVQKTSADSETSSFVVREIKRKQDLRSTAWQIDYGVSLDVGYSF